MCRSFTKENKNNIFIRNRGIPGPASYELTRITDFGYYNAINKSSKNNSTINISKYKKDYPKSKYKND